MNRFLLMASLLLPVTASFFLTSDALSTTAAHDQACAETEDDMSVFLQSSVAHTSPTMSDVQSSASFAKAQRQSAKWLSLIALGVFVLIVAMKCSYLWLRSPPKPEYKHTSEIVTAKVLDRTMPLCIIIFGATGDLARKKLFPALYQLMLLGHIPKDANIIAYGRSEPKGGMSAFLEKQCVNIQEKKSQFPKKQYCSQISFYAGAYDKPEAFAGLNEKLTMLEKGKPGNRLFFLSIPPTIFGVVAENIAAKARANKGGFTHLIIEKPFGRDSASFDELNRCTASYFQESELYRIDHYLGKEIVLNLMTLRFANQIFEPLWNNKHIESVEITFKEDLGTGGRGGYFDGFGIIRDIMQNHLLQVFMFLAIEPPTDMGAAGITAAKVNLLKAVETLTLDNGVFLGQFTANSWNVAGAVHNEPGYLDDETVPKGSKCPTFAAIVLRINNARWAGVPFLMKAGKGLDERMSEVRVNFRPQPFNSVLQATPEGNQLVMRIQPDEALYFKTYSKEPGLSHDAKPTVMDMNYASQFQDAYVGDAYERMFLNAAKGDGSLFVSSAELVEAWRIFTPLLHQIDAKKPDVVLYKFGERNPRGFADWSQKHAGVKQTENWMDYVARNSEGVEKHIAGSFGKHGSHELALFVGLLSSLLIGMYAATFVAAMDVQLSNVLFVAFFIGVVLTTGWLFMEFDPSEDMLETINNTVNSQHLREKAASVTKSDWVRAIFIATLGPSVPIYLLMAWLRDKFRKCREVDEPEWFPYLYKKLAAWDWASILSKCLLLGDVYFVMAVGFSKVTYIFLSWLNAFLGEHLEFHWILLAALIIAVLLFLLLPPLPGVAVYLFCGLLVSAQVKNIDSISFSVGCGIATGLAFLSKILGSSLQYALGYALGQNVSIQQQIGVDKVFVRAMEVILKRKGLDPSKVFLLVGGPDWPTSVLCGVLRVSLCQMILGTSPILFVMFPTVMSGAFKTLFDPLDESTAIYSSLSNACMALTAVVQPVSTMLATQAAFRVISQKQDELQRPRAEHAEVEKLSAIQVKRDEVYKKVTQWGVLGGSRWFLILLGSFLMYASGFLFFFAGSKLCFRSFSVSSSIDASFEQGGLEGDVLNIVRKPVGWFALGAYFSAVVCQVAFNYLTAHDAKLDPEHPDYEGSDSEDEVALLS